jgi:uncharacterized membrane protein
MTSKNKDVSASQDHLRDALRLAGLLALAKNRPHANAARDAHPEGEGQPAVGERIADELAQFIGKSSYILSYLAVRQAERHILDTLRPRAPVTQNLRPEHEERITSGERTARKPGQSRGRRIFIFGLLSVLAMWITLMAPRLPSVPGGRAAQEREGTAR